MSAECCGGTSTEGGKKCCVCKKLPGLFLILFGLTFLLRETCVITPHVAALIWPVIVILGGAQVMFGGMCKCCQSDSCSKPESK